MPLRGGDARGGHAQRVGLGAEREERRGRDEAHRDPARAVVDPAPDAVVALGDDRERGAGDEARHAGHRVQRQHEAVAVEDEAEVVPAAGAGARRSANGSGPAELRDDQVATSSSTATVEAGRASTAPTTGSGRAFQARSVARVSAQPRTRASCSRVHLPCRSARAAAELEAQRRHAPGRLERDRAGHLRLALAPLVEDDRQLGDAQPGAQRAVGQLDLERVALRARASRSRSRPAPRRGSLEAAGEVAHRHAQHGLRVRQPPRETRAAPRRPVLHPAAGDVARAEREVGAVARARASSAGTRGRVVGEVAVHLDHERRRRARARARSRRGRRGRAPPCRRGGARRAARRPRPAGRRSRRCRRARRRRRRGSAPRPAARRAARRPSARGCPPRGTWGGRSRRVRA